MIYGSNYPQCENWYYITDCSDNVYGDTKLRGAIQQLPDFAKIKKVINTNHPYSPDTGDVDFEVEIGTINITYCNHAMVDFSDRLEVE